MTYIVSITSQGQISIPAKLRRKLGFDKTQKAHVREEDGAVVIEPIADILDLQGALQKYGRINQGKSADEIIKKEKQVWEKMAVKRYKKTLRND